MSADTPVVDAKERQRALDPTRSFIVQAPAGSGKTALLTRRVLTLLNTVDEPEEILSITFTRKAAAEMRDRVVEALHQAATEPEPESEFDKEGYQLAQSVLKRDTTLQWNLLENPDRLRMSTIDSLCSLLAQQIPVTSTLGGVATPVENASPLYREAARYQLKNHNDQYRQLLFTLGNRFDSAESLLGGMLANRDQWLPYETIFKEKDREKLREWLQDQMTFLVVRELNAFEQSLKEGAVEHLVRSALLPLLQQSTNTMHTLGGAKPTELKSRMPLLGLSEMPELSTENLGVWQAVLKCVFTADNKSLRKTVDKRSGFPAAKKDLDQLGLTTEEAKQFKQTMVDLLTALSEAPGVEAAMQKVLALPQPVYKQRQWALLDELTSGLPDLVRALHHVFVQRTQVDFTEIALRAGKALGTDDAPTDLALAMDLRLKHILVDEFQDTSNSQFALFRKLVAGWQQGDGRTFFVVGDPMQSIYKFRAAEVSLFTRAQAIGISDDVTLEPLVLTVNFRSSPDVVNWVNDKFKSIFVPEDQADPSVGAIAYSASVASRSMPGKVQIHPLLNAAPDEAAEQVASLVEETLASSEFSDDDSRRIAILVRSKSAAVPIFTALQKRDIANLSIDMDSLGTQPVVMDLVSLTLALRFPHSRLHWLAVLRAPWCGLGLEDLQVLTDGVSASRSMPRLIQEEERHEKLSGAGRTRLQNFLSVMQPAIDHASRSSLVSWVEAVWHQLGGPILCARPVDKNAADRCLKVLYELEASGDIWNPKIIQAEMDRLFAVTPDDGEAKVHIMTMHKSKGLEFDTVILPGLSRQPRSSDQRLLDWEVVSVEGKADSVFVLAPVSERMASDEDKALGRLVSNLKSSSEDQESRRLLYVACTRAVRQLHLIAPVRVTEKGIKAPTRSLLEPLWPCVAEEFNAALEQYHATLPNEPDEQEESQTTITPPALKRVKQGWEVPVLPNFQPHDDSDAGSQEKNVGIEYLWAGRSARAIGTVVHRQLERFHRKGLPDSTELTKLEPIVKRQLQQQGISEKECTEGVAVVIDAIRSISADSTGQWLFDDSHTEARAEWALTTHTGNKLEKRVIDRTFVDKEGTRWVIDFKTGDHKGGDLEGFLHSEVERHGPQLREYAEILCRLESNPVKLALYFPLLQAFRPVSLN